jgi:Fe-S-cluster-containing dehydrogenase component
MKTVSDLASAARRRFLGRLGLTVGCTGAIAGGAVLGAAGGAEAKTEPAPAAGGSFPTKNYDWSQHRWGFGVDVNKCIGCLRCVEACKTENDVPRSAHKFRTWIERYVHIEGEETMRVDSHQDPVNVAASGSQSEYRWADRYKGAKVDKAFFVPKLCNQCDEPACVQVCPVGATFKTKDGVVLIDDKRCIGCRYCIQACPYGVRYFDERRGVADKCNWCYHRITRGMQPACVEACPVGARVFGDMRDRNSPISLFVRNNRVQVLRPESGNRPNVFYVGLDKEVS